MNSEQKWKFLSTFPYTLKGTVLGDEYHKFRIFVYSIKFQASNYIPDQMGPKSKKGLAKKWEVRSGSVSGPISLKPEKV